MYDFANASLGVVAGSVVTVLVLGARLRACHAAGTALRAQLDGATMAQRELTDLRTHLSGLRHDLRGILSPALLVADRLVSHDEAAVRRAGEVMVRTVDRAAARLADANLGADAPPAQT